MKTTKQTFLSINLSSEEYASLCIAKDIVNQFLAVCSTDAEAVTSELGDVIKMSELPRVVGILDTLTRSVGFKVE